MNQTILCIDDVPHVAAMTADCLRKAGFDAESAPDAIQALSMIDSNPGRYGLLITDHRMGRLSGPAFIRQLRRRAFHGQILIYSTESVADLCAVYYPLGVGLVLSKPAHPESLAHIAATVLSPRRAA